ncbi:hypothetical protein AWL63_10850 [Sphingomonas panacis]|uniref:T6SS Transcription factor RovC-like DNA binding domain-containing protein n=1 Tax=Sphingomonas panacis TaxID=1560345 RepID=A0A1B3ZAC8_9SPHN|nr:DUF2285 domain-containing protein [Sphingomonas panacis]AOH84389.1 hypothetical protein AWL63_10850 [Sphingomonas panacis]
MRGDRDGFDLSAAPGPITHLLLPSGGEHVLLGIGPHSIRLSVAHGTLLDGPVRLAYQLSGTDRLEIRLLALRRFAAFLRSRRMPVALFPTNAKARRWSDILRVLDALALTSRHRSVAEHLFGTALVSRDWSGGSDYLRTRTHRLVGQARELVAGGYLDLVRR